MGARGDNSFGVCFFYSGVLMPRVVMMIVILTGGMMTVVLKHLSSDELKRPCLRTH